MSLKIENINKIFYRDVGEANYFEVLKNINLEIKDGEFVEIIGKSGSGKTTLLNVASGLLNPEEGHIYIDDVDLYSLDDKKRSIFRNKNLSVVPQGQTGLQNLTVLENVLLPSYLYTKEDKTNDALSLLEKVDILPLKDCYPNELSGGELRRMVIARALVMDPKILFMDEPTGDLDDDNTKKVLNILKDVKESGKIIFMVTHDKDAIKYADKVFKMDNGVLIPYQEQ